MQWLLIAIMALTVVGGCSDDGELIQRVSDASITLDTSGCPVQVTAEIHASIGACNEVRPPVVERSDTQVRVRLETVSTADFCIALIAGHEEVVDLGTFGPGDYELVIEAKFDDYRTRFRVDDMCKR
ncbi:MAG: hypothetical protein MJE77_46680 [Proteobacteria bacterium]|nr:hypothetical protein [Pseudomonadota bacterium]